MASLALQGLAMTWTVEVVLVCALNMLGRSAASFPPIELVRTLPVDVTPTAEGFVRLGDPRIYLVATSVMFQRAQRSLDRCGDTMAIRKIASILIHEEVHLKQGGGEKAAYQAQLTTLTALGAGPTSAPYRDVVLAMRQAMKNQNAKPPAELMASTLP
jgi:hypothetical protein